MNVAIAEKLQSANAHNLTFRALASTDLPLLVRFFTAMDFDQRRARFGAGVSTASISEYCRLLDFTHAEVFGCLSRNGLLTVVELHPLPTRAGCAELAMASLAVEHRLMIYGHLLQLAAFTDGRRRYGTLICAAEFLDLDVLGLLSGMGRVASCDGQHLVDLGDYVPLLTGKA